LKVFEGHELGENTQGWLGLSPFISTLNMSPRPVREYWFSPFQAVFLKTLVGFFEGFPGAS